MDDLSIVTYNLHGLNMGSVMLEELLDEMDVVCVQEHWLSLNKLCMLNAIDHNFDVVAVTSMENVIRNEILTGRPYGVQQFFGGERG
jgi:exonuclease III